MYKNNFFTKEENVDREIKVIHYEDNTVTLKRNIKTFSNKRYKSATLSPGRKPTYNYLSCKNYCRQYKSCYDRLQHRQFNNEKCLFITLTTKDILDIKLLPDKFLLFVKNMKNNYGPIEYFRSIEFNEKDLRCHVHVILQFQNKPHNLSEQTLNKHWKLGNCFISNKNSNPFSTFDSEYYEVYDVIGAIQYMCKYKSANIQKWTSYSGKEYDTRYTYFPKGFRIFTCSRNFGIQKQPKSKTYFMSRTQANNFIKYCEDKYSKTKVSKNYVRKHCHRHKTEKGLKTFTDKVMIRNIDEDTLKNFIA